MPKYKVYLARTTWLTAHIQADTEGEALEKAYEVVPVFTADESGWGSSGAWSAEADEWLPIDEFYSKYDPAEHGPVVELDEDA